MAQEDPVTIRIGIMLQSSSLTSPKPCILKVPHYLRQVNEKAYEPQVISIGPYHHGKDHLIAMEKQKIDVLRQLLEEKQEINVSNYVMKMRELEEKARKCYEQPLSLGSDEFVKMLLLDGCFIVQLIRSYFLGGASEYLNDFYCAYNYLFTRLIQDMLLVENQLPFFVIWNLFAIIEPRVGRRLFIEKIFSMFIVKVPGKGCPKEDLDFNRSEKHLLDFTYHHCFQPTSLEMEAFKETLNFDKNLIRCAMELEEAGIEFKTIDGKSMFDIRFVNKTLFIPELIIDDYTESFLRNLIAFEQLLVSDTVLKHACDYIVFMDCLIDSPKDVEILCQHGIIRNLLGNDKAVADMINSLGINVQYFNNFYYGEVINKINKHCSKRWNKRMANLKHNYFNSPWTLISFMAAALLLLLTVLQTIFSILSYYK